MRPGPLCYYQGVAPAVERREFYGQKLEIFIDHNAEPQKVWNGVGPPSNSSTCERF